MWRVCKARCALVSLVSLSCVRKPCVEDYCYDYCYDFSESKVKNIMLHKSRGEIGGKTLISMGPPNIVSMSRSVLPCHVVLEIPYQDYISLEMCVLHVSLALFSKSREA